MANLNGDQFPLKEAFAVYMRRWYDGLFVDTQAMQQLVDRGFTTSCMWAPARLVDKAEEMLAAYQKNDNNVQGKNLMFPIVLMGMAKDYTPVSAEWGRQVGRQLVRLEEGGSVYGYRQAMFEKRMQIVVIAGEEATANSLAAQFCLFVGEVPNRRFLASHVFGQYDLDMPVTIETPDIQFMDVETGNKNITILAADLMLKVQTPYLDAPRPGEPNDGTANNPPGYEVVGEITVNDVTAQTLATITADEVTWS